LGKKCNFGDFQSGMVRNPFFWEPSDAVSSQQKDSLGVLRMLHGTVLNSAPSVYLLYLIS